MLGKFDQLFLLSYFSDRVRDADSGRVLTVFTNQPAVRFYTGDDLNVAGKNSHRYIPHSGFLLATQNYPDAVHHVCLHVDLIVGRVHC